MANVVLLLALTATGALAVPVPSEDLAVTFPGPLPVNTPLLLKGGDDVSDANQLTVPLLVDQVQPAPPPKAAQLHSQPQPASQYKHSYELLADLVRKYIDSKVIESGQYPADEKEQESFLRRLQYAAPFSGKSNAFAELIEQYLGQQSGKSAAIEEQFLNDLQSAAPLSQKKALADLMAKYVSDQLHKVNIQRDAESVSNNKYSEIISSFFTDIMQIPFVLLNAFSDAVDRLSHAKPAVLVTPVAVPVSAAGQPAASSNVAELPSALKNIPPQAAVDLTTSIVDLMAISTLKDILRSNKIPAEDIAGSILPYAAKHRLAPFLERAAPPSYTTPANAFIASSPARFDSPFSPLFYSYTPSAPKAALAAYPGMEILGTPGAATSYDDFSVPKFNTPSAPVFYSYAPSTTQAATSAPATFPSKVIHAFQGASSSFDASSPSQLITPSAQMLNTPSPAQAAPATSPARDAGQGAASSFDAPHSNTPPSPMFSTPVAAQATNAAAPAMPNSPAAFKDNSAQTAGPAAPPMLVPDIEAPVVALQPAVMVPAV